LERAKEMNHRKEWLKAALITVASLWLFEANTTVAQTPGLLLEKEFPVVDESLLPTGELIRPAGRVVAYDGRPIELSLAPGNDRLLVKDRRTVEVIDTQSWKVIQSVPLPDGASITGNRVSATGKVFVTNAKNKLLILKPKENQKYEVASTIEFPKDAYPCGIAIDSKEAFVYVCLSKRNSVAVVDLISQKVIEEIAVGVAPFDVVFSEDEKQIVVSNLGGARPGAGEVTATSAGTEVVVDERGVAKTGSVSVVDIASRKVIQSIAVGLQPSTLARFGNRIIVCNTNQDSLSVIDLKSFATQEVIVKPEAYYPFGSMPNGLAITPDAKWLFISLAGNNAVAVMDLAGDQPVMKGLVPTAWYPSGLCCDTNYLYVACTKGTGSRSSRRDSAKGRNSHDTQGVVQQVKLAEILDSGSLAKWTKEVIENASTLGQAKITEPLISGTADGVAQTVEPLPIPKKLGQPSVFKHVIYVIKENRTFDQVFGDIAEARSAPELCTFPEGITPNHHALARRFGILDNYYCNGILSADGHSWATEGNVTPYLERAFGGFTRSYTFGNDPLTYSSTGFIWDRILAAGLSFRNYGEMDYAKIPDGGKYQSVWDKYQKGEEQIFGQEIGIERLRRYSCQDYPGWNMSIPDVLRMDRFLKEFQKFDKEGGLPNFSIVYLPQDHLGGGVTGRAHMADNDLALGRLIEAVSKSRYWESTALFINEDDPQNGFDHIDGHRSVCLVVSAYSRPGVNHHFYNQTSVLRTILHIFGLPPLNQKDASAPLMTDCFDSQMINKEPYTALPATVALNESPPPVNKQSSIEQKWRSILATVPIERTGMKTPRDEDNLNRFIWHEQMGWETPYPAHLAGYHGKGLKELNLMVDEDDEEDEE
jgi:YVTN family beta-propeller protein